MSGYSVGLVRFAGRSAWRGALAELWLSARSMLRARQTRQMLLEMDSRMLGDIGIGRGDALVEAARPMWDLTPRRR